MLYLKTEARKALIRGTLDQTISDNENEIIEIVQFQEVVTYASAQGSYTFDYTDIIDDRLTAWCADRLGLPNNKSL